MEPEIFPPLLSEPSEFGCEVITLPMSGSLDYLTITEFFKRKSPQKKTILTKQPEAISRLIKPKGLNPQTIWHPLRFQQLNLLLKPLMGTRPHM